MIEANFQRYQEETFDSYVKCLIRNESRNAKQELARQSEREVSLSSLLCGNLANISHEDRYSLEKFGVHIRGGKVDVFDHLLGQAIMSLVPKWRDIIVMYYFLDMGDTEIGAILKLTTGAIRHRRKVALDRLKKLLEDMGYEK